MKRVWIKWGALALLVLLLAGAVLKALGTRKAQQTALSQASQAPVPALNLRPEDVLRAEARTLTQSLAISGVLKAVNTAVVKARVAGELQGLLVREGDTVAAGQVLGRIDPTESLARLKQAKEQADAARSQIEIAQRQFDNNRNLVEQGFISKTALDTSSSTLAGAQASYKAALANVELAQKSLDDSVLRAPLGGQISQRLAQPGERLGIDARVVEIINLSALELEATLSSADAVQVRVGQTAQLRIEGHANDLPARVVRISPMTLAGSRNVLVYLALPPTPGLRQGMFAQGQLGTQTIEGVALPLDAVRTDKPLPYVQVVQGTQVAHRNVTLGGQGQIAGQANTWVLVQGLASNEVVLRSELGSLRAGTPVQTNTSPSDGAAAPSVPAPSTPTNPAR